MSRDLVQEPLVDVLLGLDSGKANVDLLIDCRYGSSRLRIRRGRIVDASAGEARGVPALDMLLALDEGRFELVENEQEAAGALDVSVGEALFGQVREPGKLDSAHPVAAAVTRHAQTTPGLIHSTRRRVLEQKTLLGLAPTRESSAEPRQKSDPPAALPLVRTIPPARFAGPRATRPLGTGYSSAPPPAYAEERVALPTTMTTRTSSSAPPPASDGAASLGSTLAKASQAADVAAPLGALSSARGVQDFGTSSARSEVSGSAQGTSQGAVQMPPIQPIEAETQHETGPVPSSQLDQSTLDRLEALHEGLSGTSHAIPAPPKSAETWPAPESPKPEANSSQLPRVGRYEVLARLKSGGMGSIYLCRLSGGAGFRRLFAMKVLHQNLAQQEEVLSLFFREANLLAQLHHPNVVGIVDVGSVQQPYLVLDYVEGGSLHELLRASSETRHPGAIVSIILDALNGLAAAHQMTDDLGQPLQLVHNDLTPHNLLVGVDGTCRVTDFGVAGAAGAQGEAARGKPSYVAPERLLGKLADQRADLFSLGVVLYVSLTGVDPFLGATADETVRKVLEGPILPPSEVGLRPPPSLDWVCMKALARNPEERFQSAEEMATQLRRVAARDEALSLAGPGPVASWVRTVLKPTLEARRAAAIKGVEVLGERGSLFTIPPGAVTEGDVLRSMSEPPPSSQDFGDRTEVLSAPAVEPRGRAVIYAAVALAVVAVGWVMLFPDQTKHLLKMDSAPAHMTPEEAHELTREAPVIEEPAPEESVEPVHVPTIRPRGGHDE